MEAKYVYGVIETPENGVAERDGIDICRDVYTIRHKDISAVVCDSPLVDYTLLPRDQGARYLLAHQRVIERVMDACAIIPMKLGTYTLNTEETREILDKGYLTFKDILRKIENRVELDVVATWNDLNLEIREIGEEQDIKELKNSLLARQQEVSASDQIMIGNRIKTCLDKRRDRHAAEISDALGKVCLDSRANPLMDDIMICNTAFFVERFGKDVFEELLDELDGRFGGRINFRCVGPLPPYSFYTMETRRLRFEDLDRARKTLHLGVSATKGDIVRAYRTKAKLSHPDKNRDAPDGERQFGEITTAYRILLDYCRGDACSFEEKEFRQNSLVVKVRG